VVIPLTTRVDPVSDRIPRLVEPEFSSKLLRAARAFCPISPLSCDRRLSSRFVAAASSSLADFKSSALAMTHETKMPNDAVVAAKIFRVVRALNLLVRILNPRHPMNLISG
jgi:hypothetical protein